MTPPRLESLWDGVKVIIVAGWLFLGLMGYIKKHSEEEE